MKNKRGEKVLVTAALPYVNNIPHLGNIAGSHLPADIFARFCRLKGYDTAFIGGSDEHGTPIEIAAEKKKTTPKKLCGHYYKIHKKIYDWFDFSYDNFSRTSKPIHHKTTQEFFKKIYKKGWLKEEKLKLPYCYTCQRFLADRYIEGTCPYCGYERARGDQCERCGNVLDPIKLKNAFCAVCRSKNIKFHNVPHLFFDIRKLSPKLQKWIKSNHHWREQVRKEALGWLKEGLKPRAITRDLKWGIKVPLKGYEKKVFYVWFEAPIGYISSTKEKFPRDWKKFWQNSRSKIYHFLGKDNVAFHTIFWPAYLMAHGDYNLPYNVVGLQYLNYEGQKFSKSRGWGVFCENLPEAGLSPDYWRFYLSLLIPETGDTDFRWQEFKERVNGDLIGNFGNFIHRTLSIINNHLEGKVSADLKDLSGEDKTLIKAIKENSSEVDNLLEQIKLREALKKILELANQGNKYFDQKEPWRLVKENRKEAEKTLLLCLNVCRTLAILISPFLPETSQKIWKQLGLKGRVTAENNWNSAGEIIISKTQKIRKPKILFSKLEDKTIEELKIKTSAALYQRGSG